MTNCRDRGFKHHYALDGAADWRVFGDVLLKPAGSWALATPRCTQCGALASRRTDRAEYHGCNAESCDICGRVTAGGGPLLVDIDSHARRPNVRGIYARSACHKCHATGRRIKRQVADITESRKLTRHLALIAQEKQA